MTGPKLPRTRRSVHLDASDWRDGGASSARESNHGHGHGNATSTRTLSPVSGNGSNALPLETHHNHSRPSRQTSTHSEHSSNGREGVDVPLNRIPREPPLADAESDGLTTISHELDHLESLEGSKDDSADEVDMACRRPSGQSGTCSCASSPSRTVRQKNGKKTNGKASSDDIDYIPFDLKPSVFDLLGNIVGIGSYLSDVGTDCWVAYTHSVRSNWWWLGLTLGFVIIPSLVMTFFSTVWYIQEHRDPYHHHIEPSLQNDKSRESKKLKKKKVSTRRWVSRFIFLFFQVAPVLRYLDSIIFCCRSWMANKKGEHHVKRHWYERMLYEDTDATLLRLMECFMEAAPQLVLQLYIISINGLHEEWYNATAQVLSCVTSLFSLSWAIAAYHKALRLSLPDKSNLHWKGFALLILWRVFTIGARISAMALFASEVSPWIFAAAVALHWLVMFIWCLTKSTSFCQHAWQEPFFKAVMSVVYIFGFLNLLEGNTRFRYLFFYALVYLENLGMMMVWFWMGGTDMRWFHKGAVVSVVLGFLVGVTFQMVYYKYFHPNNEPPWNEHKPIRCCLPWAEVCHSDNESPRQENVDPSKEPLSPPPLHDVIVTRGTLRSHHPTSTQV